jgi:hypothetical protein
MQMGAVDVLWLQPVVLASLLFLTSVSTLNNR